MNPAASEAAATRGSPHHCAGNCPDEQGRRQDEGQVDQRHADESLAPEDADPQPVGGTGFVFSSSQ